MDTITLTLHKKWFDLILSGEKTEEYREIKPYWVRRLIGNWHHYTEKSVFYKGDYIMPFSVSKIRFRNGYAKDSREMIVEWVGIEVKEPNADWCEQSDIKKLVFALKLGRVISCNCR